MDAVKQRLSHIKAHFSKKMFVKGLGVVFVLYVLIFTTVFFTKDATYQKHLDRLANKTTIINNLHAPSADSEHSGKTLTNAHVTDQDNQTVINKKYPNAKPLDAVPVAGLYQETPQGLIPMVREIDKLTPFKAYKRPFDMKAAKGKKIISLAIYDIGLSQIASESALRSMPPEISFIISPYSQQPDLWTRQARSYGHETWLPLTVETDTFPRHDVGPHTMMIQSTQRENMRKFNWLLSSGVGYAGFVSPYNARFLDSLGDARPIIEDIAKRGLALVNASSYGNETLRSTFLTMNAPYADAPIWIDIPESQENIRSKLKEIEDSATKNGYAAGIFNPVPVSYQEILKWVETLEEKGFMLAPLSVQTQL